ncbi:Rv1733c family protein [Streptomyces sp. NPDC000888]
MARTQHSKVRLWRWRRNPLRRPSDVIEAWLLLTAYVLALVGACLAGLATQGAVERHLDQQRVERQAVTAALVEDAKDKPPAGAADDDRVWVRARWTAPDGSTRTGQTKAGPDARAGTRVTVWTDQHGALSSKPVSHEEARLQSALAGVLTAVITVGVVAGGACAARAWLDRRRMEQWAADWARTDTRWGGKTG